MTHQPKPTRLNRLIIENFRAFSELEVVFHPRLTVLVAINGGGKSAVLDAIAVAWRLFVNTLETRTGSGGFKHDDVRRTLRSDGSMQSVLPTAVRAFGEVDGTALIWNRVLESDKPNAKTTYAGALELKAKAQDLRRTLEHFADHKVSTPPDLPLICYYGTGRLWASQKFTEKKKQSGRMDTSPTSGYADCLSAGSRYKFFEDWFVRFSREAQVEQVTNKPSPHSPSVRLSVVRSAVDAILRPTGWKNLSWDFAESCLVAEHPMWGRIPVNDLSDGIRNVIGLVGDLAHRAARLNPHLGEDAALLVPGIVLIDEVDMHLHPTWQQYVLGALQEAFPTLQFIVTTHSPQVLTTVAKDNIRIVHCDESTGEWVATVPDISPLAKDAGDALAFILGTHSRPSMGLMDDLHGFEQLVRSGLGHSTQADALRGKLEAAGFEFSGSERALLELLHRKANPAATQPLF